MGKVGFYLLEFDDVNKAVLQQPRNTRRCSAVVDSAVASLLDNALGKRSVDTRHSRNDFGGCICHIDASNGVGSRFYSRFIKHPSKIITNLSQVTRKGIAERLFCVGSWGTLPFDGGCVADGI